MPTLSPRPINRTFVPSLSMGQSRLPISTYSQPPTRVGPLAAVLFLVFSGENVAELNTTTIPEFESTTLYFFNTYTSTTSLIVTDVRLIEQEVFIAEESANDEGPLLQTPSTLGIAIYVIGSSIDEVVKNEFQNVLISLLRDEDEEYIASLSSNEIVSKQAMFSSEILLTVVPDRPSVVPSMSAEPMFQPPTHKPSLQTFFTPDGSSVDPSSAEPVFQPSVETSYSPTIEPMTSSDMIRQTGIVSIYFDDVPKRVMNNDEVDEFDKSMQEYLEVYVSSLIMRELFVNTTSQYTQEMVKYENRALEAIINRLYISVTVEAMMAPDEDIVIVVTDALSQSGNDDNGTDFLSYIEEVPLLGGDDSSYFGNAVAMDFVVDTSSSPTSSQSAAHTLIGSVTLAGICGATVSLCHSI